MPRRSSKRKNFRRAKNKAKRKRQRHRRENQVLTVDDLKQVLVWKERIETNIKDAVECYKRMEENSLFDDKDLLAALARYVENTGEAITQLDVLTHEKLFAMLTEVPVDDDEDGALTWKNLKGIRIRLAHKFWDTDYGIVLSTVRDDFPVLATLFFRLQINQSILREDASGQFTLKKSDLVRTVGTGVAPSFGDYLTIATYSFAGWQFVRLSLIEEPPGFISGMHYSIASQTDKNHLRLHCMHIQGKSTDVFYPLDIVDDV